MKTIGLTVGLLLFVLVTATFAAEQIKIYSLEKAEFVMSDTLGVCSGYVMALYRHQRYIKS